MARPITAGLEPYRKDPADVVQVLPVRDLHLGWAAFELIKFAAVAGWVVFAVSVLIWLERAH